jgi:Plant protein of unknown function
MPETNFSRAPFNMRYSRKSDFEPKFVSIGPYYYKRKNLHRMENVKTEFTSYFLKMLRAGKCDANIDDLIQELKVFELEDRIRKWYGQRIDLQTDDLFRMLVSDSCFIIRIILCISRDENESMFLPCIDIKRLRFDLLLLENQIPFFFLKRVYDFLKEQEVLPPLSHYRSNLQETDNLTQKYSEDINSNLHLNMSCLSDLLKRKDPNQHEANNAFHSTSQERESISDNNFNQYLRDTKPSNLNEVSCPNLLSNISCIPNCFHRAELDQSTNSLPQFTKRKNNIDNYNSNSDSSHINIDHFLLELKPFICLDMPWEFNKHRMPVDEPDHLLDLYWKWCLPFDLGQDTHSRNHRENAFNIDRHKSWVKIHLRSNADKRIPNANDLYQKAGVTFGRRKHEKGFGVEFHNGILQLPHFKLDSSQTTLLVNLIAFEDFKPSKDRVLTSYILLLDGLINTKKDVELLQHFGIIHNKLSSIQAASTFFHEIGNICLVDYEDHYCQQLFKNLNDYYISNWNRQFAKLQHTSFSSPWAVISLLVGALLLILSALQTAYTICSYYQQKHC